MKLSTKQNFTGLLLISPFLAGCTVFYFVPFVISIYYSLTTGMKHKQFVGLKNYIQLFANRSFMLALKNTLIFMIIAIPLLICTGLLLAELISCLGKWKNVVRGLVMIPLIVPIASTIKVWQLLFGDYGIARVVVILMFVWKNCGYLALIYSVALSNILPGYIEAARIDGGSRWKIFKGVVLPILRPTTFFALLVSILQSFKIFREVYLLTGQYPDTSIYFVQHYMNHNFYNLNYQKLSSASVVLSVFIMAMVAAIYVRGKKSAYMEG